MDESPMLSTFSSSWKFFVKQQQFCDYTSSNYLSITNLPHEVTSYARDTDQCLSIIPCWKNTANISHDK
jgi:hypothetical protein